MLLFYQPVTVQNMSRISIFLFFLICCLSAFYFRLIFFTGDIHHHYNFVLKYLSGEGSLPANFLYYYIVSLFTFDTTQSVSYASIILLALSIGFKFLTICWFLEFKNSYPINHYYLIFLSILLLFITPLYIPQLTLGRFYLGSFTPTVWHNSTTIFLLPFAILLFILTIKQLNSFSWNKFFIIIGLVIINAAIKPSYLFVYVGALPFILLFTKYCNLKAVLKQLLPAVIAMLIIIFQKELIYETESVYSGNASVVLAPFKVYNAWHGFSLCKLLVFFLISLITSVLFPLFVLIKKGIKRNDLTAIYTWVSYFGAILIFILFAETGERWAHGNFFWQIVPSTFILFLVAVKKSLPELSFPNKSFKDLNLFHVLLFLHILFGIVYAVRIPIYNSFI